MLVLLVQFKVVGYVILGIIVLDISQYIYLGDGLIMIDNLIYNVLMVDIEFNGIESGVFDDCWVFMFKFMLFNYGLMVVLVVVSCILQGYKLVLVKESFDIVIVVWVSEVDKQFDLFCVGNMIGGGLEEEKFKVVVELLVIIGDMQYKYVVMVLLLYIEEYFGCSVVLVVCVLFFMDNVYKKCICVVVEVYKFKFEVVISKNLFGVVIIEYGWVGNGIVLDMVVIQYYLYQVYFDFYSSDFIYCLLDYLYGMYLDFDILFVLNVGMVLKKVVYGMNCVDYLFISGVIVLGVFILKFDLLENMENWLFLWGENEYVIDLGVFYLFIVNVVFKFVGRQL